MRRFGTVLALFVLFNIMASPVVRATPQGSSPDGTIDIALPTELVEIDLKAIDVSAGAEHTCAVLSNGTIECWGSNVHGQSEPPQGNFVEVSAGGMHSCARLANGRVKCWGCEGLLSDDRPADVGQCEPPEGIFRQIDSGWVHSCGVDEENSVICWGAQNTKVMINQPEVEVLTDVGHSHACALSSEGDVACWGNSMNNQARTPRSKFKDISPGFLHTCGINIDGAIYCWGHCDGGMCVAHPVSWTQSFTTRPLHTGRPLSPALG